MIYDLVRRGDDLLRATRRAVLAVAIFHCGCAQQVNPSFSITPSQAHEAVVEMRQNPKPLRRPVVLIGGLFDPNISPTIYKDFIQHLSTNSQIITVSPGFCGNFEECRRMVLKAVDAAAPGGDSQWTSEVDVIGASLGGLVARYSAAPSVDPKNPQRLKIARLFSISSPHSGATMAQLIAMNDLERDMRPDSELLKNLARQDAEAQYELVPYVHLGDQIVGQQYAAPPGRTPYWLDNQSLLLPHEAAMIDERILADIARRLRYEIPFALPPAAPLPN